VTSHSAQGATADKVIVHAESGQSAALVNERFAYVAGSRMREGLDVYTDNAQGLSSSLERQFDKTVAVHDRTVAPRQEHGAGDQAHSAGAPFNAQQDQTSRTGPATQEVGHSR
jgi:hypothetical protein